MTPNANAGTNPAAAEFAPGGSATGMPAPSSSFAVTAHVNDNDGLPKKRVNDDGEENISKLEPYPPRS